MKTLQKGIILTLILSFSSIFAEVSPETMVDVFQRLEALETKTRELNGENEVLKHKLDQLKKAQKQGFLSIDERIDELSSAGADKKKAEPVKETEKEPEKKSQAENTSTPDKKEVAEKEVSKPKPKAPTISTNKDANKKKIRAPTSYEKETYKAAFSLMKTSPTAATKAFQEYIRMQPNSPLAANAQYWIGEIMYSHNNYKGAVQEFIKVLQKYKYSGKAPDAAIKLGYSFYALKNWAYAKRTFEDVIKYFPDNKNAVELANRRLAKIKSAGH